ncbi:MAG: tetratricopeptide repeat protein, partial [Acidobacteria bacterium]|nr:tetratricopeptide repeat protein [Acidobacteriota bacterium]
VDPLPAAPAESNQIQPAPPLPSEDMAPERRADILMARKMYREAVEVYQQAIQSQAVILNKIGIAYHQMMQLDTAKKYYESALKINPRYSEALNNIGTVYYAQKNFGKATGQYKKALKVAPKSASIYSNLGTAYFAQKKYKDATEAYQQALALDPEIFEHRSTYGTMLQERSVEERAKFHYYLAKTYAKAGMNDRALQYLRKALEEGFKDKEKLAEDPEFNALRETPEFKELLALEPRVL